MISVRTIHVFVIYDVSKNLRANLERMIWIGGDWVKSKNNAIHFVESCYRLYEHKMYYIAYSILHDVGLSEDAVQEAFIRLMKCEMEFSDY